MAKKHIDRASLIAAIRELKELSNEQKSDILQLISEQKKYGLVWEDSPEEVEEKMRTTIPVLTEDKDKFIDSDAVDAPNHILIEGDNLEALTALTYTHEGKIDVIYIDPPYNTGKETRDGGFMYNDKFINNEDEFRHSKWLSFMSKRLKLAKRLLSETGVIYISIGDDEGCNLKLLCDDIFSENNFIETYFWESTFRPDNSSPILRRNAEFVHCYAKTKQNIKSFRGNPPLSEGMASLTKAKESIKTLHFPANCVHTTLSDGIYKAGEKDNGNNLSWILEKDAEVENGMFVTEVYLTGHSYWATAKKIKSELEAGTEIWIKSESFVPYYKKMKSASVRPSKLLDRTIVKDYLSANAEIDGLIETGMFNNPKPTNMVGFLLNFTDNQDATILDFFAGSGTTLHATMQLNEEDGGHRQCILCTNNENGICEEVTYERNKRVINGYTKTNEDFVEGLHGNKLRYFKIEHVERENNVTNRTKLIRMSTDLLCVKENLYDEVGQFGSLKFKKSIARYFADANKQMLIVYEPRAVEYIANELRKDSSLATKHRPLKIYVYSDGAYAYTDEFEGLLDKVELTAMPNALSQALHNVLPEPITNDFEEGEIGND